MEYFLLITAGILGGIGHYFYRNKSLKIVKSLLLGTIAALIMPLFIFFALPDKYIIIANNSVLYFGAALTSAFFFEELFIRINTLFFLSSTHTETQKAQKKARRNMNSQNDFIEGFEETVVGITNRINKNRETRVLNILSNEQAKTMVEIKNCAEFKNTRVVNRIIERLKRKGLIIEELKENDKAWRIK